MKMNTKPIPDNRVTGFEALAATRKLLVSAKEVHASATFQSHDVVFQGMIAPEVVKFRQGVIMKRLAAFIQHECSEAVTFPVNV